GDGIELSIYARADGDVVQRCYRTQTVEIDGHVAGPGDGDDDRDAPCRRGVCVFGPALLRRQTRQPPPDARPGCETEQNRPHPSLAAADRSSERNRIARRVRFWVIQRFWSRRHTLTYFLDPEAPAPVGPPGREYQIGCA